MKAVVFEAAHAPALRQALAQAGEQATLLRHDDFVDHYYASNPALSRLHLMLDREDRVVATLGVEDVTLRLGAQRIRTGVLSNTFSLRPGAFPLLFAQWARSAQAAMVIPSAPGWRGMLARQDRWTGVPGLRIYWLNWPYPAISGEPAWKRLARPLARRLTRVSGDALLARAAATKPDGLALAEEARFDAAMALPSPAFGAAIEPDVDWLNWRYAWPQRYALHHVFRVLRHGVTAGSIVLSEWPRRLVVSYTGGGDPFEMAHAILLGVSRLNAGPARHRPVMLASMHPVMADVFMRHGFRPDPRQRVVMVAGFGAGTLPRINPGDWLVNLDLGDFAALEAGVE